MQVVVQSLIATILIIGESIWDLNEQWAREEFVSLHVIFILITGVVLMDQELKMIFALSNSIVLLIMIKSFSQFAWAKRTHHQTINYLLLDGQHLLVALKRSPSYLMRKLCLLVTLMFATNSTLDECTKINTVLSEIDKIIAIQILVVPLFKLSMENHF